MEGSSRKRKQAIVVTQGFECSRLEYELLAVAYEHAVPIFTRVSGSPARPEQVAIEGQGLPDRDADLQ